MLKSPISSPNPESEPAILDASFSTPNPWGIHRGRKWPDKLVASPFYGNKPKIASRQNHPPRKNGSLGHLAWHEWFPRTPLKLNLRPTQIVSFHPKESPGSSARKRAF